VFAAAGALPWERLLQIRLETLAASAGYRWPEPGNAVLLPALAEANGVAPHLLRRDLAQALSREIWQDSRLTQDFRNAPIALLESRLTGEDAALAGAVMDWLRGTLRRIAQLRQARIGRRVGRQNARAVLMSLCRWVRGCGGAGLLLLLNIRRLHRERRVITEGLVYTPAVVMDCYEVLRQVIDDAEHFPSLFLAALADDAFLSDDPRRSLGQHAALRMRVWDDVRPQGGTIRSRHWCGSRRECLEAGPSRVAHRLRGVAGRGAKSQRGATARRHRSPRRTRCSRRRCATPSCLATRAMP
jgi:hypothetical protein